MTKSKSLFEFDVVEHQRKITSAAYAYGTSKDLTISCLCYLFNVSGNTMTEWLCEAISKGYITSYDMCTTIIDKHIAEYERTYNIHDSALRTMYKNAMFLRLRNSSMANRHTSTTVCI